MNNKKIKKVTNGKINKKDKEWLGGFFDGDGSILVYKDHISLEATTGMDDEGILTWIKKNFGGSITSRSGAKALRWRSRKHDVVIKFLKEIQGYLYNPIRIKQFKKALVYLTSEKDNFNLIEPKQLGSPCTPSFFFEPLSKTVQEKKMIDLYEIPALHFIALGLWNAGRGEDRKTSKKLSSPISRDSAYLSGFLDADGTISISTGRTSLPNHLTNISGEYGKVQRLIFSKGANQLQIKCSCKEKVLIESIFKNMGFGSIFMETRNSKRTPNSIWHWIVPNSEIYPFINYIEQNPLRGYKKKRRFHLIKRYLYLKQNKYHLSDESSLQFKKWKKFCYEWYNIQS